MDTQYHFDVMSNYLIKDNTNLRPFNNELPIRYTVVELFEISKIHVDEILNVYLREE